MLLILIFVTLIFIKNPGEGNMRLKKKVYDMVMRLKRLREEEVIVLREVKQHCQYMASMMEILKELCAKQMDEGPCSFFVNNSNAKYTIHLKLIFISLVIIIIFLGNRC